MVRSGSLAGLPDACGRLALMVRTLSSLGSWTTALVVVGWLAVMIVPPAILWRARADWLADLDRPDAQSNWDTFRSDMRQQSGRDGPVQRKVPKSVEPPVRVWLRDYFQLAVVAWVLFAGVLGGFFCLLVAGVLRGNVPGTGCPARGTAPPSESLAENQSGRHDDDDEQHERDAENTQ